MEACSSTLNPLDATDLSSVPSDAKTPKSAQEKWASLSKKAMAVQKTTEALFNSDVQALSPLQYRNHFQFVAKRLKSSELPSDTVEKMLVHLFMLHLDHPCGRGIVFERPGEFGISSYKLPKISFTSFANKEETPSTLAELVAIAPEPTLSMHKQHCQNFFEALARVDYFQWKQDNLFCGMRATLAGDFAYVSGVPPQNLQYCLLFTPKFNKLEGLSTEKWFYHAALLINTEEGDKIIIDPATQMRAVDMRTWVETLTKGVPQNCKTAKALGDPISVKVMPKITNLFLLPYGATYEYDPRIGMLEFYPISDENRVAEQQILSQAEHDGFFRGKDKTHIPKAIREIFD